MRAKACRLVVVLGNPRLPVTGPTRVMREREYDDAIGVWTVYDCEGKVLQKNAPCIFRCNRTSQRKSNSPGSSFFHGSGEAFAETRSLLVVIDDFGEKFSSRGRDETGSLHRFKRRASAKTSSAG